MQVKKFLRIHALILIGMFVFSANAEGGEQLTEPENLALPAWTETDLVYDETLLVGGMCMT